MALAKCHKCGAELIAPEDGKPYWCTACSYEEDLKQRSRTPRIFTHDAPAGYQPPEPKKLSREELEQKQWADLVRNGQSITESNQPGSEMYRGIFIGKNFHLYRLIREKDPGNIYHEEGYLHVYGMVTDNTAQPPNWVPRKPRK